MAIAAAVNLSVPRGVMVGVRALRVGAKRPPSGDGADEAVVRAVYAEHGAALLRYALRLTGDRGHAEDLVQEAVLRAWRHADQLANSSRPLRPWLFTVMANLAADRRRTQRSRPVEVGGQWPVELAAADELDRAVQAWQVADALAGLSAQHRAILLETYYRGRSVAETSAVLGIPAGTVKSRSYYALRALRLALQERGWTG